jgi:hypothetical protein
VSPALFWDLQPARLPLHLAGDAQLQKKSEKHKKYRDSLASVVQVALQLCTNNYLTGQNLNELPESHLVLNPPQFATRNVVASNNETATRPQAAWGA